MKHISSLTQQKVILNFASRLKNQYWGTRNIGIWRSTVSHTSKEMEELYNNATKFTKSTTLENAQHTLGTFSPWLDLRCDVCNKPVDKVVLLGQTVDYEQNSVGTCEICLQESLELVQGL